MDSAHRKILSYMAEGYHVEAGNGEGRGIAPYSTLAAMERRGWVELSWKRQSALYGSAKPYRIARMTEAGRAALGEALVAELEPLVREYEAAQTALTSHPHYEDGEGVPAGLFERRDDYAVEIAQRVPALLKHLRKI